MIRNMRGMTLAIRGMSDRVQGGSAPNSLDRRSGLRSREHARMGATLGATRTNNLEVIRTHLDSGQERVRGHGLI